MTDPLPDIPGYRIHSLLGEGGFAKVYLATHTNLNRDVALKVMNPMLAQDQDFCERFLREGRDTAELSNHPNIVTTYDIGQVGDLYYIAMQYLPGPNLRARLDSNEPYQHPINIMIRITDALAYVHTKGFVHRDIKPANILFNEANEAVLSDFGIAKGQNRNTQLTQIGAIVGTAKYMSPEQTRGNQPLDGRSDLYSLGVVFHELLTKKPPFQANDAVSLMMMHANDPVPTLPPTQSMYQPVLERLMAKSPDDRYQDGHELIEDLERRFLSRQDPVDSNVKTTSRSNRRMLYFCLTGLGAVALLIGSILTYKQFTDPTASATTDCPVLNQETLNRLDRLLDIALIHEEVGRITQPPGANALEAYSFILELDPCNKKALEALDKLGS